MKKIFLIHRISLDLLKCRKNWIKKTVQNFTYIFDKYCTCIFSKFLNLTIFLKKHTHTNNNFHWLSHFMKSLKISVHVYTLQLVGWVFIRLNIEHVDKFINDKFINSFEILVTCASDTTNFYYRHKSWLWHNSKKVFNEKILQGKGKKTKVAKNKPPKIKQTNLS